MAGDRAPDATRARSGPRVIAPLREFLHTESAGGVILVVATVVALVWANSPWKDAYFDLWHTDLAISLGDHTLDLDLQEWVNDGLMAIFFFVVGLEIKRELVEGELRGARRAALPAIAALGGMVVPALIYVAINAGGDGADGLGHPDGHRHRDGGRHPQPARQPGRALPQAVPPRPGDRRRHRCDRGDRDLLHRRHRLRRRCSSRWASSSRWWSCACST